MIRLARSETPQDSETLHRLITRHYHATGSPRAAAVLEHWDTMLPLFWKVIPLPAEAIAKTVEIAKPEEEAPPAAIRS